VRALRAAGVDHAFCVPGESFLGLLDALYDEPSIRVVATRHEGGASFMAEAYAKLTHRPAVCMGTRMVGAGNMAIGIHTARQDSVPVLAIVGQVATDARYREAFQEAEVSDVFTPVAKWAVEPPSAERLGELTLRAARVAMSGRPGPVVLALREDLLAADAPDVEPAPLTVPRPAPDPARLPEVLALLRAARRPLMVLGNGVLAAEASALYVQLAEREELPVVAAWRRPDVFPNDHPLYLGHSGVGVVSSLRQRMLDADVVLAVGTRLNEYTSIGYQLPAPGQRLVHVDLGAEVLGGHGRAELPFVADAGLFAQALLDLPGPTDDLARRRLDNERDRRAWEAQTTPGRGRARAGFVDQQAAIAHVRSVLPRDAIVTTDAGNFGQWPARYLRWQCPGTFLGPTSGAMGYAVPAALAARLARPRQKVVAFVGDGGFLMTGPEVETAVRVGAPFVTLVYDNGQYGTIRMHQEREHPGRPIATGLGAVDFAAVGRGLGALGYTVRDDADFPRAFDDALRADQAAVLHLHVDPDQLTTAGDER